MKLVFAETIEAARRFLDPFRARGMTIGFVPTMGALHAGHRKLIDTARQQCDLVVVSIFVNPLQFDRNDDFERYARQLPEDLAVCEDARADLVFAPSVSEMYPSALHTSVDVDGITRRFCGASRPGHFRGVTTVVAKLFHIVQPSSAFFGEKDAQQLAAIETMVRDLNFAIRIIPVETVREPDGLALSSRNARLSPEERAIAPCLHLALREAKRSVESGIRDARAILDPAARILRQAGVRVDYLDLADPQTFQPVAGVTGPVRALGAIWIGSTRLIDNLLCTPPRIPEYSP